MFCSWEMVHGCLYERYVLIVKGGPYRNGYRARRYPHLTGIWPSPQLSLCIVLPCCTVVQTKPVLNVALSSQGGYRMFPGVFGSALPHPLVPASHEPCTLGLVPTLPHSIWLNGRFLALSRAALTTATHKKHRPLPPPLHPAQKPCPWPVHGQAGYHLSKCNALPLSYSPP